jgi:hypothetical protein
LLDSGTQKLINSWLPAEEDLPLVERSSEIAGFELRIAHCKKKKELRISCWTSKEIAWQGL